MLFLKRYKRRDGKAFSFGYEIGVYVGDTREGFPIFVLNAESGTTCFLNASHDSFDEVYKDKEPTHKDKDKPTSKSQDKRLRVQKGGNVEPGHKDKVLSEINKNYRCLIPVCTSNYRCEKCPIRKREVESFYIAIDKLYEARFTRALGEKMVLNGEYPDGYNTCHDNARKEWDRG